MIYLTGVLAILANIIFYIFLKFSLWILFFNILIFFVFVIIMLYGITLIGFFGKNIPVTILGGMSLLGLGLYTINNGIIIYRDWLTNYFSYVTIAIGAILAIWATLEAIQEGFN